MPLMGLEKIQRKPLEEKLFFFFLILRTCFAAPRGGILEVCAPELAPETSSGDGFCSLSHPPAPGLGLAEQGK